MSEAEFQSEAEPEVRLSTTLSSAIPSIPRNGFRKQRRFTVRLGRQATDYSSAAGWGRVGRADMPIFLGERPLEAGDIRRENFRLTSVGLVPDHAFPSIGRDQGNRGTAAWITLLPPLGSIRRGPIRHRRLSRLDPVPNTPTIHLTFQSVQLGRPNRAIFDRSPRHGPLL